MAEVVNFPGVMSTELPAQTQPNVDAIALLERYLAAARRGEIVGIAMAAVAPDGLGRECWSAVPARGGLVNVLVAAVAVLQHRLCAELIDGSVEVVDPPAGPAA